MAKVERIGNACVNLEVDFARIESPGVYDVVFDGEYGVDRSSSVGIKPMHRWIVQVHGRGYIVQDEGSCVTRANFMSSDAPAVRVVATKDTFEHAPLRVFLYVEQIVPGEAV